MRNPAVDEEKSKLKANSFTAKNDIEEIINKRYKSENLRGFSFFFQSSGSVFSYFTQKRVTIFKA